METLVSIRPFLAVLIPFLAVPGILSSKNPNVREGWTFGAGALLLAAVVSMLPWVLDGSIRSTRLSDSCRT